MRKRPQTKTRSAKQRKKGYKLQGLTKAEATTRAKKAWITKHQRYKYNQLKRRPRAVSDENNPDFGLSESEQHGAGYNVTDLKGFRQNLKNQQRENLDQIAGVDEEQASAMRGIQGKANIQHVKGWLEKEMPDTAEGLQIRNVIKNLTDREILDVTDELVNQPISNLTMDHVADAIQARLGMARRSSIVQQADITHYDEEKKALEFFRDVKRRSLGKYTDEVKLTAIGMVWGGDGSQLQREARERFRQMPEAKQKLVSRAVNDFHKGLDRGEIPKPPEDLQDKYLTNEVDPRLPSAAAFIRSRGTKLLGDAPPKNASRLPPQKIRNKILGKMHTEPDVQAALTELDRISGASFQQRQALAKANSPLARLAGASLHGKDSHTEADKLRGDLKRYAGLVALSKTKKNPTDRAKAHALAEIQLLKIARRVEDVNTAKLKSDQINEDAVAKVAVEGFGQKLSEAAKARGGVPLHEQDTKPLSDEARRAGLQRKHADELRTKLDKFEEQSKKPGPFDKTGFERAQHEWQRAEYTAKALETVAGKKQIPRESKLGLVQNMEWAHDPRLLRLSVEEAYEASGHESAKGLRGWKKQFDHTYGNNEKRFKAFKSGLLVHGLGEEKNPAKSRLLIRPNKHFKYELNKKIEGTSDYYLRGADTKYVDYDDLDTTFKRGERNRAGQLKDGEFDQVHSVQLEDKFHIGGNRPPGWQGPGGQFKAESTGRFRFSQGRFDIEDNLKKQVMTDYASKYPGFDEKIVTGHKVVVQPGLTQISMKLVNNKKATEVDDKRIQKANNVGDLRAGTPRDTLRIPGSKTAVYYVPPDMAKLVGKSEANLIVPGYKNKIGERLLTGRFSDADFSHEARIPGLGVGPEIPTGKMLEAAVAGHQARRNQRFQRIAEIDDGMTPAMGFVDRAHAPLHRRSITGNSRTQGTYDVGTHRYIQHDLSMDDHTAALSYGDAEVTANKSSKELNLLAGAAASAGAYRSRNYIKRTAGPQALNKKAGSFIGKHPRLQKITKDYLLNKDELLRVKEDISVPFAHARSNWADMIRRPASSPKGTNIHGPMFGNAFYRKKGIHHAEYSRRGALHDRLWIQQVAKTRADAIKLQTTPQRSRSQESAWRSYQKALSNDAYTTAGYINTLKESLAGAEATIRKYENETGRRAKRAVAEAGKTKTLAMQELARTTRAQTIETADKLKATATSLKHRGVAPGMEIELHKTASNAGRQAAREERKARRIQRAQNGATAGAVVGATFGAHWLYHKHKQSKLADHDRESYLNAHLPGPINTKLPHVSLKNHYRVADHPITRELRLANRNIPRGASVGLKSHTIKLRPEDRGYGKNAPIFGGLSFRSLAKEGSFIDPGQNWDAPRKRSYRESHRTLRLFGKDVGKVQLGDVQKVAGLSSSNPRRWSQQDREKLAYLYGTGIKSGMVSQSFKTQFGHDERLMKMIKDKDQMNDIKKRWGKHFGSEISSLMETREDIASQGRRFRQQELQRQLDHELADSIKMHGIWRKGKDGPERVPINPLAFPEGRRPLTGTRLRTQEQLDKVEAEFLHGLPNRPGTERPLSGSGKARAQQAAGRNIENALKSKDLAPGDVHTGAPAAQRSKIDAAFSDGVWFGGKKHIVPETARRASGVQGRSDVDPATFAHPSDLPRRTGANKRLPPRRQPPSPALAGPIEELRMKHFGSKRAPRAKKPRKKR